MDRIKAMDSLEDHQYCWKLTQESFEDLLIRAGFDRKDAHKMALNHGWNRLNAGEMV